MIILFAWIFNKINIKYYLVSLKSSSLKPMFSFSELCFKPLLLVPIMIVRFPNKLDDFSFILELIDTWAIYYCTT